LSDRSGGIIRMGPAKRLLALVAVAALTSAGCGTNTVTTGARGIGVRAPFSSRLPATTCHRIACVVGRAIPGATVSYGPHQYGPPGAITLDIREPSSTRPPSGTKLERSFAYTQRGWVASMAAYLAATRNPRIRAYQLLPPTGHPTQAMNDYYQGPVSGDPTDKRVGDLKLDSLRLTKAIKQVRATLRVLRSVLPSHAVRHVTVDVISLDPLRREYALSISLTVGSAHDLDRHIGDLVLGVDSGLIDGPESLIEGVAMVASTRAQPLVGAWSTIRNETGSLEFAPFIHYTCFETTTTFPDLTGGPRVLKGDGFCHG
jgi:hypothetical protein